MSVRHTSFAGKNSFFGSKKADPTSCDNVATETTIIENVQKARISITRKVVDASGNRFSGLINKLMASPPKGDNSDEDLPEGKAKNDVSMVYSTDYASAVSESESSCPTIAKKSSNYSKISSRRGNQVVQEVKPVDQVKEEDLMSIPCINCGSHVKIDDIDKHSEHCQKVLNSPEKTKSEFPHFSNINSKLFKLQEHIMQLRDCTYKKPDLKDMPYYTSLLQYINDSINVTETTTDSLNLFRKLIINIESILLNSKTSISMKILLERAKFLILEKHNVTKEIFKKNEKPKGRQTYAPQGLHNAEDIRKHIEKGIKANQNLQTEMSMWKRKANSFRKMAGAHSPPTGSVKSFSNDSDFEAYQLNDVNSDVDKASVCTDLTDSNFFESSSSLAQQRSGNKSIPNINQPQGGISYKDFVRVVLRVKFEVLESKASGQAVPEKALWNEAIKQNVDSALWEQFIVEELKNPEKYIQPVQKKRVKKSFRPTLDTIYEEN